MKLNKDDVLSQLNRLRREAFSRMENENCKEFKSDVQALTYAIKAVKRYERVKSAFWLGSWFTVLMYLFLKFFSVR